MEKRWLYKQEPKKETVEHLSKKINVNEYLCKILLQRGISDFDQAKKFFRPSLASLHDPFLMLDMHKAVNRLTEAVFNEEKILIYGDYDVDGTTSVSLMYLFLKKYNQHLEFYIPDRYSEGYGISEKGISYAAEKGFKLIIIWEAN
ncbi:MAG: DHH family phosphoesterase, partial [Bacteroidota bacterium]